MTVEKKASMATSPQLQFVQWFRCAAPYIHAFRGRTFVIAFGGEVVADDNFIELVHDFNLLNSLGVRLVLVHGARPQIETALREKGVESQYVQGLRVTDAVALDCVKQSAGEVRSTIEALLSMGLPNSPMAGADIRVGSGNFVTAKPMGVLQGIDMKLTGEVRKIDGAAIRGRLEQGEIVVLSAIGYSPTGEIFNLSLEDVATQTAIALSAHKLIFLMETAGVTDASGELQHELDAVHAEGLLVQNHEPDVQLYLPCAIRACRQGVARVHLISRHTGGAILQELFTREGVGTMITHLGLENLRPATIDDIGGLLSLLEPLEQRGVLVRRSRELLEIEIERFTVLEHDGVIIGCAALYPFPEEGAAELACLAVNPYYSGAGHGDTLLAHVEHNARKIGVRQLFVLTTRTAHWFIERGFTERAIADLPQQKQSLYNYQRNSKVFRKAL